MYHHYMICGGCKIDKDEEEFAWRNKAKGMKQNRCKNCHALYIKGHYSKNKEEYKARAVQLRPALIKQGKDYILDYLKSNPCVDCGMSDIRVLQFDHREPLKGHKKRRVGSYVQSFGKLKEEIAKCDVRCANCHMIKTSREFGWERI